MSKNISPGQSQLLHAAVKSGDVQMITALARSGANIKAVDEASETPLVKEAFDGAVSAIKKTTNVEERKRLVAQYTNAMQALIVNGAKVIEEPGEFKEFAMPLWNADGAYVLVLESALRPISLSNIVSPNFTKKDFDETLSLLRFAPDDVKERVMNDPLIKYLVSLPEAKLEELCRRSPEEASKIDVKQLLDAQKQAPVQETSVKPVMNPASALPNVRSEVKDVAAPAQSKSPENIPKVLEKHGPTLSQAPNLKTTTAQAELCDIFRFGTGFDRVPELLRQGAGINKSDSLNSQSPILLALEYTRPTSIAMLAELGVDFDKQIFQTNRLIKPVEILQNKLKHPDISEAEKENVDKTLSALIINGAKYGGQIPAELAPALKAKRLMTEDKITLHSILAEGFKPQQFRDMIKLADECASLKNKRRFNQSPVIQQLQELSDKDLGLILAKPAKEAQQAEQDLERLYKETTERRAAAVAQRAEAVVQHEAPALSTQSSVIDSSQNASHERQASVQNVEVPAQPAQAVISEPNARENQAPPAQITQPEVTEAPSRVVEAIPEVNETQSRVPETISLQPEQPIAVQPDERDNQVSTAQSSQPEVNEAQPRVAETTPVQPGETITPEPDVQAKATSLPEDSMPELSKAQTPAQTGTTALQSGSKVVHASDAQQGTKQPTWGDTVKGYWNWFKGAPAIAQVAPKASKEVEDFLELAPADLVNKLGRDKMIQQLEKLPQDRRDAICNQDPQTIENIVKHWNNVYDVVSKIRLDYANPEYIANVADALELKALQKQVDPYMYDLTKDWEKALPASLAGQYQRARQQYNQSAAKFNNRASKNKKGGAISH